MAIGISSAKVHPHEAANKQAISENVSTTEKDHLFVIARLIGQTQANRRRMKLPLTFIVSLTLLTNNPLVNILRLVPSLSRHKPQHCPGHF
jgi:hypothetical protein